MDKRYSIQAAAWTLATLVTLTVMVGLDLLAAPAQAHALQARQQPAATQMSTVACDAAGQPA